VRLNTAPPFEPDRLELLELQQFKVEDDIGLSREIALAKAAAELAEAIARLKMIENLRKRAKR
jgi:hypothetical protein